MWIYKNKKITSLDQLPKGSFGFVYIIENLSKGKFYIGKKNLYFKRTKKLTKKELLKREKGSRATKKTVIIESDWLTYNGSNKELISHIKEGDKIKKTILFICYSSRSLTYQECKHLFLYNVLEDENAYNGNILKKFFKGNLD